MHTTPFIRASLILFSVLFSSFSWAQTRYVTDQFEITLRSGPSTSNNIVSMLKSGTGVNVIEQDDETKYSLVETSTGKKGYVLSRFLDNVASGRERFSSLQIETEKLKQTINKLLLVRDEHLSIKKSNDNEINSLKQNLTEAVEELNNLRTATQDTIQIIQQNDSLKTRINELETDKSQLTEENLRYKDSTAMDWFIRGAAVTLIAFLLGILVTRIRWKKRDSWSNY